MLVRKVSKMAAWARFQDGQSAPIDLLKEFVSGSAQGLSVYEIDDEEDRLRLCAALCMCHTDGPSRSLLTFVERKDVDAAGLKIEKSLGETKTKFDNQHFDITLEDLEQTSRLLNLLKGTQPIEFSAKQISEKTREMLIDGTYDPVTLADFRRVDPPITQRFLKAISERLVAVNLVAPA